MKSETPGSAATAVHPHGRGDNNDYYLIAIRRNGSPPRAWGQSVLRRETRLGARFTPTGVGTMPDAGSAQHHPRGSPPRAWGQSLDNVAQIRVRRFTPTGVGTIVASPVLAFVRRFTPTGVGTILAASACKTTFPVHPHGRGDNGCLSLNLRLRRWFTPTGVGTIRACVCFPRSPLRFTPTGVGTIGSIITQAPRAAVHPHGRGDNMRRSGMGSGMCGSPPRAWGQLLRDFFNLPPHRFTPTGVGTM